MTTERVYLIGFMGAGKTTVGRLLAESLGWDFVDLDAAIERSEGKSVADIFRDSGERYFRALESRELREVTERRCCVVALGGGTYLDSGNRSSVEATGLSIYLDTPLESILERVDERDSRPLFSDARHLADLYSQRRPSYKMASVIVDTRGLSPREIADRVVQIIAPL